MTDLAKYVVQLEVQAAKYQAGLDQANRKLSQFHRDQTRFIGEVRSAFVGLAGVVSVSMFARFVKSTIDAADGMRDLSLRLGTTTEFLSEMQHVAKLSGVEFDGLTKNLGFLSKTIGEAGRGNKEAAKAFAELHVSAKQLAALSLEQQFTVMVDRLSKITNESERAALATKVFGRDLQSLQIVMDGGVEAMQHGREEARQLGIVLSTQAAEGADRANDAMVRMKASINSLSLQALPGLAKALEVVATGWNAILFGQGSPVPFENQIREIEAQLQKLTTGTFDRTKALNAGTLQQDIDKLTNSLAALRTQQERALGVGAGGIGGPSLAAIGLPDLSQLEEANATLKEMVASKLQMVAVPISAQLDKFDFDGAIRETEQGLTDFLADQNLQRERSMIDAWNASRDAAYQGAQQEIAARAMVTDAAVGLLQAFGAEHRGAAIAALAIEKAKAIQEILIYTKVAQMHALAQLGPIAGAAAALKIGIMGKVAAGLVAATGLVEALQLSRGGTDATRGTSANPISTRSDANSPAAVTASSARKQKVVEFHVHGNVYGAGGIRKMLEDARDVIDGADVILFSPDSRQAQVLVGG